MGDREEDKLHFLSQSIQINITTTVFGVNNNHETVQLQQTWQPKQVKIWRLCLFVWMSMSNLHLKRTLHIKSCCDDKVLSWFHQSRSRRPHRLKLHQTQMTSLDWKFPTLLQLVVNHSIIPIPGHLTILLLWSSWSLYASKINRLLKTDYWCPLYPPSFSQDVGSYLTSSDIVAAWMHQRILHCSCKQPVIDRLMCLHLQRENNHLTS